MPLFPLRWRKSAQKSPQKEDSSLYFSSSALPTRLIDAYQEINSRFSSRRLENPEGVLQVRDKAINDRSSRPLHQVTGIPEGKFVLDNHAKARARGSTQDYSLTHNSPGSKFGSQESDKEPLDIARLVSQHRRRLKEQFLQYQSTHHSDGPLSPQTETESVTSYDDEPIIEQGQVAIRVRVSKGPCFGTRLKLRKVGQAEVSDEYLFAETLDIQRVKSSTDAEKLTEESKRYPIRSALTTPKISLSFEVFKNLSDIFTDDDDDEDWFQQSSSEESEHVPGEGNGNSSQEYVDRISEWAVNVHLFNVIPGKWENKYLFWAEEGKIRFEVIRQGLSMPEVTHPIDIQSYLARNLNIIRYLCSSTIPHPAWTFGDGFELRIGPLSRIKQNCDLLLAIRDLYWDDIGIRGILEGIQALDWTLLNVHKKRMAYSEDAQQMRQEIKDAKLRRPHSLLRNSM